ncbi:condensin complex subunit 2/barren [Fimicolochytrium jonesii]|uniref:condensin complex subunit 2/barren n=1 Tax=Fimicolochytrium jonesii TaxID=1396493 RepID=UPI0022FDE067|nr:condensin complex subunit 2/barren [Fimicolochytrium jonesii]KAI8817548.1 condensin complex subunit 2/barren [Fimicolochytrium jonesii]
MLAGPPKTPLRRLNRSNEASPGTPPSGLRGAERERDRGRIAAQRRKSFAEDRLRRMSVVMSPMRKPTPPTTPGRPQLSESELKSSFEEWMKIAAENKINANNSWNLALIDYFHDMTLLRDGDSINFQKASCTLDGCVKIYTSRVDSVDSETKKLLSGLVETNMRSAEDEEEVEEGTENAKPARKKANRSTNTLENDINNLNVKKLDLEFMVDPLFKKTSADFDEGGAHGLLLNHLSISRDGKIIFDASDEGTAINDEPQSTQEDAVEAEVERERIDISKLQARFADTFQTIWQQDICPSLKTFEFNSSSTIGLPTSDESSAFDMSALERALDEDPDLNPVYMDDDDDSAGRFGMDVNGEHSVMIDGFGPGNPLLEDVAIGMTMGQDENMFSYFDTAMMKNWAGPEHWRLRPVQKDKDPKEPGTVKRKRKVEESIDFLTEEDIDLDILFAPATASIDLPKDRHRDEHLLPDDMHFSSKELLRLFMKPMHKIKFYKKDGSGVAAPQKDGPVDAAFWAENEMTQEDNQTPVDTGFADHSDGEDNNSDEEDDIEDFSQAVTQNSVDFGDQLVGEPKKTRTVALNYARVAKKVDVIKLKDNIWRELTVKGNGQDPLEAPVPETAQVEGRHTFKNVVSGLDDVYPEKKRKDISVAFCFICVLHLANEKNLRIDGNDKLSDLTILQNA